MDSRTNRADAPANRIRFVHTGDLHLDSPFVGLSDEAPEAIAAVLREATLRAWDAIVDLALAERVDFFLVAGDAFENANRTLRGQLRFRDGLKRLSDAGIASFVVTGNHDPDSGWSPAVRWPERAYRFPSDRVAARPVLRDGVEIARVYGIGYAVRDVKTNLARTFKREPDATFAVGLLHANVGGDPSAGNYAPCTIEDLRKADMDYWALGHVHRHRVLSAERPTAVYCGNPQGRDPNEEDARGCYLVTVEAGKVRPEFRAVDVVRWQHVAVPIEGIETEEALAERIAGSADAARAEAGRSIVVRVRLVGRGPMHRSLARPEVRESLRTVVRDELGAGTPFAWVESIRDETRPVLDIEERRRAGDFLADVLGRFESAHAALVGPATDPAASPVAELDEVLDGLYANTRARPFLRDRRPGPERLAELLERAEALVADRLADGD